MKTVAVIPARYGSTRLPGKPLIEINGIPMIVRVCSQVSKAKLVDEIIVATDDKRIVAVVKDAGFNAVMTSRKHKSGSDRIAEVAGKLKCDIVVNVQGDEPFIPPQNIDKAIKALQDDKSAVVSTLCMKFKSNKDAADPNKVKVVIDKNGNAIYFSRSIIPFNRSSKKINYFKHIGLYIFRKSFLLKFTNFKSSPLEIAESLEQLRILENGYKIKVVEVRKDSISIDTKEDLRRL
ncbi:MAG: 3-deoxy-manno-octulosonate cytidylyltransferase [Ignavibacteriaceae bacterium]|nr:3-deoxy-manno-octulosonate cytidylyltransferase [Ignavibacteria bacterium]MEB2330078.1 3-deoxy-manno-octulosonate cytidylyltransferase [Ignavibacteriaceae bacterium]OQY78684.1 MAG: 3-deoxy-D-manno-octulosonate cytidylyltransferase [Ignavibacteriales bacterium UTCHB1]